MFRISSRVNVIPKGAKGWIDPDGTVMPLDSEYELHGQWIRSHYKELKTKYPDLPSMEPSKESMLGEFDNFDAIRDFLISKNWIHVFGIRDVQVLKLDEQTKNRITDALMTHQINLNFPIRIYEKSTDTVVSLREGGDGEFLFSID